MSRSRPYTALSVVAGVALCALAACLDDDVTGTGGQVAAGLAATTTLPPGNLTITPDGRLFLSLHQNYAPPRPLVEIDGQGQELVFPRAGRVARTIALPPPVTDTNSWINDLDIDYPRRQLYVSDPAGGANAALIVVDLASGVARRVLRGHASVVPTDTTWTVRGKALVEVRPSGQRVRPVTGVDGLVLDAARQWLYYGALDSRALYRVRTADLADASLSEAQLAARVERYSDKPPSDGMRMDLAGKIYLGDLPNAALGVIASDRVYREIARGDSLAWFDDFEFGTNGLLYVVDTQLHLSPPMNAGVDAARRPFRVFGFQPLAPLPIGY